MAPPIQAEFFDKFSGMYSGGWREQINGQWSVQMMEYQNGKCSALADTFMRDGRMDEEHKFASFWNRSSNPINGKSVSKILSNISIIESKMMHSGR